MKYIIAIVLCIFFATAYYFPYSEKKNIESNEMESIKLQLDELNSNETETYVLENKMFDDMTFTRSAEEHELVFWEKENNCTLIVNGKDITDETSVYYVERLGYVHLPFIAVVENLGGVVTWENDALVRIEYESNIYEVDFKHHNISCSLDKPIFMPPPGSGACCPIIALLDHDVLISGAYFPLIFNIDIDKRNCIVYVTSLEG